ncbi:hypothetical protein RI367_006491 [Sorochytrium milnesiophthora]
MRAVAALESTTSPESTELMAAFGVQGDCVFYRLRAFDFGSSITVDVMHLMFCNLPAKVMDVIAEGVGEDRAHALSTTAKKRISTHYASLASTSPSLFGTAPRSLFNLRGSFKAEEWRAFSLYYSLPTLFDDVSADMRALLSLNHTIARIVNQHSITRQERTVLQEAAKRFVVKWEMSAYRIRPELINYCTITIHQLLHLERCVTLHGAPRGYWQLAMERLIGGLLPFVKSRGHPYESLLQNLGYARQVWQDK